MARPQPRFHDFIGHKKTVDLVCRTLDGAMSRREPFPNTLMLGPSGVGKTMLSSALVKEFGTALFRAKGCENTSALIAKLRKLNDADFLFIDEAQGLGVAEQELLLGVIDERTVSPASSSETQATQTDSRDVPQATDVSVYTFTPSRQITMQSVTLSPSAEPAINDSASAYM